jgi:hypothetical protein
MSTMPRTCVAIAALILTSIAGCGHAGEGQGSPRPTLLLAQAQFVKKPDATGQLRTQPGAARLVILQLHAGAWEPQVLEDPDSNVFHKAIVFADPAAPNQPPGILTIGANAAALKLWHRTDAGWSAKTLWQTTFGGEQNRLRDFEIADVTGDDQPEIVVATHDQGVVAVLTRAADGWHVTEIDRKPNTFVHEIEIGDLDGDGINEIYATPSAPNRLDGTPQPGMIVVYRYSPGGYQRTVVEELPHRHVKEILVADLAGTGRPSLFAALEAEMGTRPDRPADAGKVAIKRYRYENGKYVGQVVASLPDAMCRFLNAGDVDGDGKPELIASTLRSGIWLLRPGPEPFKAEPIDKDSSGFEHATLLADLDGDGTNEIYVAADDQHRLRRYRWDGTTWDRSDLYEIQPDKITFGLTAGML